MMSTRKTYRLGTTAIAAVLALSATQLAAQEAPATDAPVIETPTVTSAPPPTEPAAKADPLAPAAEPEATMPAETIVTSVEPIESAPAAKAVAKKSVSKSTSSAKSSTAKPSAPSAPAAPSEVAAATAPPVAAPAPTVEAAPVAETSASDRPKIDEAVPLAGGAGAVILALAGAGMAVRRRKRREEEEELEQDWSEEPAMMGAEAAPEPEPGWNPPVVQPKPATTIAATEVSQDFDTSSFGRHVQAAYAGPTPENPSLSLRKRLKIAGELDRRERVHGAPKPTSFRPVADAPQSMNFMFSGPVTKERTPEPQF